jgi:hypothetical protein
MGLDGEGLLIVRINDGAFPVYLRVARDEPLNAGCDAGLSKPFTLDDLISAIRLSTRPSAV